MRTRGRRWMGGAVCAATGIAALAGAGAASAATGAGTVAIPSTAPAATAGTTATTQTTAISTQRGEVHIFLGRDPAGMQTLAQDVADPHSNLYGQFLTPAQVQARFGATPTEITGVTAWLRSEGLTVTAQGPYVIAASAPAATIERAFTTTLAGSGAGQITNTRTLSMPADLAGQVATVTVTGTAAVPEAPRAMQLRKGTQPTPGVNCSTYWGQTAAPGLPPAYGRPLDWAPCGYTPNQLRSATGAQASGLTGAGVTVAVISGDDDSTALADANAQASADGFPQIPASHFTAYVEPGSANGIGDVESAIDVESIHAEAPGATIAYVAGGKGATDEPTLNALEQIVSQHLADVVTDSWGVSRFTQATEAAFTNALQRASMEGITVNAASGDVGSDPAISYLFPASDPWLTTVGGTSLAIGSAGQQLWLTGWEDGQSFQQGDSWSPNPPGAFWGGSTGGVSTLFPEPYYQQGIVSGNVVDGQAMEVYPDISDDADPITGQSIAYTNRKGVLVFRTWGGTSMASPLFAGTEADVIQGHGGTPIGYANPTLYGDYGSALIQDVTSTPQGAGVTEAAALPGDTKDPADALFTLGQAQLTGLSDGVGYDDTTGLGAPSAQFFTGFDSGAGASARSGAR